jgi:hypothetical protein
LEQIENNFLRGAFGLSPIFVICHESKAKIIFSPDPYFYYIIATSMKIKMFAKNQSSKEQKIVKVYLIQKNQDFLENQHASQTLLILKQSDQIFLLLVNNTIFQVNNVINLMPCRSVPCRGHVKRVMQG